MAQRPALANYKKAIAAIVALYTAAQKKVAETYWQIGRWVVEVEQDGEARAAYGEGVLSTLSEELTNQCGKGFSVDNLERMRGFYLKYKNSAAPRKLDWTHYVALLSVEDPVQRARLEQTAKTDKLSSRDLAKLAKEAAGAEKETVPPATQKPLPPLKRPTDLRLYTYRRACREDCDELADGEVGVDCGLFIYRGIPAQDAPKFTTQPSFTYAAKVKKVVDGDTVWVGIRLGFNSTVREKVRLRGVNAPEKNEPGFEAAKKYVARRLPKGCRIVIKTYRNDLHGRFVADLFYLKPTSTPDDIVAHGVYLNQELLDTGHAVRMKE